MVRSRKELAVFLSKLNTFSNPKQYLEQYSTDSEVAAILIWQAMLSEDIEGKEILDLGCGTGILGIASLLLGAKFVYFVDIDPLMEKEVIENLEILQNYWEIDIEGKWKFICADVEKIEEDFLINSVTENSTSSIPDSLITISNPPFGTQNKHIDKLFLEKGFLFSNSIYSIHKTTTKEFIINFIGKNNFYVSWNLDNSYPLKNTLKQHKKKIERIEITLFNFRKN